MKTILMVAFHYPPVNAGSGVLRTLKFSQYLPQYGWRPIILAPSVRALPKRSTEAKLPEGVVVERALALDAARHFTVAGRYPAALGLPDRWASWIWGAKLKAKALLEKYQPDVIWSTYPIASAQRIGMDLAQRSGKPWVADLRDPMTDVDFPPSPAQRRHFLEIERGLLRKADRVVVTTPGAAKRYQQEDSASNVTVIENGFDEADFTSLASYEPNDIPLLVHSGALYPSERDPRAFFEALAGLRARGELGPDQLRIVLRATQHDKEIAKLLSEYRLSDWVRLAPGKPYMEALTEVVKADGLLLLQAANCNAQIPAKAYEYLRSGRPILALTDLHGDTANLLRSWPQSTITPLQDAEAIAKALLQFVGQMRASPSRPGQETQALTRESRTGELAALLDQITM